MATSQTEYAVLNWFGQVNYSLMEWTNDFWWPVWAGIIFIGCLISMAPLSTHHEQPFYQIIFVWVRRVILWLGVILIALPFVMLYLYDMTMQNQLADSQQAWLSWFLNLAKQNWFIIFSSAASGWMLRFMFKRYALPAWSGVLRRLRNKQTDDSPTDIRQESSRFTAKDFLPSKHYKKNSILIGLDENNKPIHVPSDTWYETNMQVIGPTRYGKGVIMGGLMDQAIRRGDSLFYIDPKKDKFAPHVMYQACLATGRKFYYVTLHDDGIGKWAPFAGGTDRDALTRLESAFGLEFTGDPGTDYYKSQERKELEKAFQKTRNVDGLKTLMEDTEANRINAELARWSNVKSLCPKKGSGFSIEKALKEGAVVYVQGSLDDSVVKTATKIFITELIQEARRLDKDRDTHLTAVIDEVSFLASKTLAQALATAVGFRVNFVLAYQSQNDLLNIDDKTVNPKYVHQSINVNSQIKAVYGGADFETAEWAANLSGTIVKEVTKMEKTDISGTGGETWENQRTVGAQEENYINTNMVLSLPPRVCVFVQPRHLASVCFSSFVPVKDMEVLTNFLDHKDKVYTPQEKPQNTTENPKNEGDENPISLAKENSTPKEKQPSKLAQILPFKKNEDKKPPLVSDQGTPSETKEIGDEDFFKEKENIAKPKPKEKTEAKPKPLQKEKQAKSNDVQQDVNQADSNQKPAEQEKPEQKTEDKVDPEAEKKKQRNKARKAKQKAKKQNASQDDKKPVSLAKPANEDNKETHKEEGLKTEISDDFAMDFGELSLETDENTMSLLNDLEEEEDK